MFLEFGWLDRHIRRGEIQFRLIEPHQAGKRADQLIVDGPVRRDEVAAVRAHFLYAVAHLAMIGAANVDPAPRIGSACAAVPKIKGRRVMDAIAATAARTGQVRREICFITNASPLFSVAANQIYRIALQGASFRCPEH